MIVSDLLDERGWSPEDLAAMLGERGYITKRGRPISPAGITAMMTRDVPPAWTETLQGPPTAPGLGSPAGADGDDGRPGGEPSSGRRGERPPSRPAEVKPVLPAIEPGARKRISGAYKFLGGALAAGSGSEGVAVVFADQADPIAQLWIDAAAENPYAARFVEMISAGGTMGDLVGAHLYLAGASLYVLGAGIPGGDAIFAKYSRYKPVRPVPAAAANGHSAAAPESEPVGPAEGAVVDGPV